MGRLSRWATNAMCPHGRETEGDSMTKKRTTAKKCGGPPDAGKRRGRIAPWRLRRERGLAHTMISAQ